MKVVAKYWFSLFLMVVAAGFVAGAAQFGPMARRIPLIVSIPVLILSILQVITEIRAGSHRKVDAVDFFGLEKVEKGKRGAGGEESKRRREWRIVAWVAAFLGLTYLAGFIASIAVFTALYFRLENRVGWRKSLVIALITTVAIYVLFVGLLQVPFYRGILSLPV